MSDGSQRGGIGCGALLILIGVGIFAERVGWIPETDWLLPAVLVALGAGTIYNAVTGRR